MEKNYPKEEEDSDDLCAFVYLKLYILHTYTSAAAIVWKETRIGLSSGGSSCITWMGIAWCMALCAALALWFLFHRC